MMVAFSVQGKPTGKGRPRACVQGGRVHAYTPATTRAYEMRVQMAFRSAAKGCTFGAQPIIAEITANFNVARLRKADRVLARSGAIVPLCKPDGDNIAKIILDALNGIAYNDDRYVFEHRVTKRYAEEDSVMVVLMDRDENKQ